MKLTVQCHTCFNEAAQLSFSTSPTNYDERLSKLRKFRGYEVELSESFIYELICDEGHEQRSILKTPRFEILMQISLNAILDGYHRDSVTSFAAALERFYEYYINVQSIKHDIDHRNLKRFFKSNLPRSERQIGAFLMLYFLAEKEEPSTLESVEKISGKTPAKFRNDVVHIGTIPTRQEAIEFGNRVISLIFPVLSKLRQDCLTQIEIFEEGEYDDRLSKAKETRGNHKIIWHRHNPVFGANHEILQNEPTIEELLVQIDSLRKMVRYDPELQSVL